MIPGDAFWIKLLDPTTLVALATFFGVIVNHFKSGKKAEEIKEEVKNVKNDLGKNTALCEQIPSVSEKVDSAERKATAAEEKATESTQAAKIIAGHVSSKVDRIADSIKGTDGTCLESRLRENSIRIAHVEARVATIEEVLKVVKGHTEKLVASLGASKE